MDQGPEEVLHQLRSVAQRLFRLISLANFPSLALWRWSKYMDWKKTKIITEILGLPSHRSGAKRLYNLPRSVTRGLRQLCTITAQATILRPLPEPSCRGIILKGSLGGSCFCSQSSLKELTAIDSSRRESHTGPELFDSFVMFENLYTLVLSSVLLYRYPYRKAAIATRKAKSNELH